MTSTPPAMATPNNPAVQQVLDLLVQAVSISHSTRYSELASSTIIVLDHLLTIDQEIELIWNAHWSIGKVLFIMNRYYSLCSVVFNNYSLFTTTLTDSFCLQWFQWQGWTGLVACMIGQVILQVRLYALYYLNKKILALMVIWFIAATVSSAVVMGTTLAVLGARSHIIPGIPFCIPINVPHHLYAFWIPIIAFESLLCGMALYRGLQGITGDGSLFRSGRRLVNILVRDSVLFFLVVFAAYVTNFMVLVFGNDNLIEIPLGWSIAMSCVMGNRLILNVRHLHKEITRSAGPNGSKDSQKDSQKEEFEPTRDLEEFRGASCDTGYCSSGGDWEGREGVWEGEEGVWSTELRTTCVHYGVAV